MKLQRYINSAVNDDYAGNYDILSDDGPVCLSQDVETLEAENAALHAECDRLTALVAPDYCVSDAEVATKIMQYLGWSVEPSLEPGTDPRVEKIAGWIRAAIDTAMLRPQKPMSAEEVTEPGFYWWKFADHRWVIVIARYDDSRIVIKTILGDEIFIGKFIGPIKTPEVQG